MKAEATATVTKVYLASLRNLYRVTAVKRTAKIHRSDQVVPRPAHLAIGP